MPFCNVSASQNGDEVTGNNNNKNDDTNKGIKIFYRTYGRGPIKVLMIIGFAATHSSWAPQIRALAGTLTPNDEKSTAGDRSSDDVDCESSGIEVCVFDNRGMGLSSVPTKRAAYTTRIMAEDAIALMDHLGWDKAHVFGHSMGGMIACKLAAMVPDRVLSLALLNVTGGGKECIPKINVQTLSVAIRFLMAKTPQKRAAVDLDTHYSQEYLEERVGEKTRRAILHQEYIEGISATGMQSSYGFEGQVNACWRHKITSAEFEAIRDAGFLVSVIHGRHDIIAQLCHARKFAEKLYPFARMIELHGGHLVSHERTKEVNASLQELIEASTKKITTCDWTNLPMGKPGCMSTCITWRWSKRKTEGAISLSFKDNCIAQIHDVVMCSFGLLSFTFQEMIKSIKSLRHLKRKFFFGPDLP